MLDLELKGYNFEISLTWCSLLVLLTLAKWPEVAVSGATVIGDVELGTWLWIIESVYSDPESSERRGVLFGGTALSVGVEPYPTLCCLWIEKGEGELSCLISLALVLRSIRMFSRLNFALLLFFFISTVIAMVQNVPTRKASSRMTRVITNWREGTQNRSKLNMLAWWWGKQWFSSSSLNTRYCPKL